MFFISSDYASKKGLYETSSNFSDEHLFLYYILLTPRIEPNIFYFAYYPEGFLLFKASPIKE
jgi:hypothetical protein